MYKSIFIFFLSFITLINGAICYPTHNICHAATQQQTIIEHDIDGFLSQRPKYPGFPATVGIIPYSTDEKGNIKILLGKEKKDGTWSDFGGKFDSIKDQTFFDALLREYCEEMGVNQTAIIRDTLIFSLALYIDKIGKREIIYVFCKIDPRMVRFNINNEKSEVQWFELNTLKDQEGIRPFFRTDLIESEKFQGLIDLLKQQTSKATAH